MTVTQKEKERILQEYEEQKRKELSDKMRALRMIDSPKRRAASRKNAIKARKVLAEKMKRGKP